MQLQFSAFGFCNNLQNAIAKNTAREIPRKREEPDKEAETKKKETPSRSSLSFTGKEEKSSVEKLERKDPQSPILEQLEHNRKNLNEIVQEKRGQDLSEIVQQIKKRREEAVK